MSKKIDYSIYLVTDDPSRYTGNWLDNVRAAVDGGVTCVQYRDTENPPRMQYERILRLRDAIGKTPIVVNNDAVLAQSVKANGVHVGQSDMSPSEVRAIVGDGCEIGLSITDRSQLSTAFALVTAGCVDCLGIGPVYDARKTKADAASALGLEGFESIVESVRRASSSLALVAIGGITLANAAAVWKAGAEGLAIVSAFSKSEDPYAVARNLAMLSHNRRK